jgi:hypothetical protein
MTRLTRTMAATLLAVFSLPSVAFAQQRFSSASLGVHLGLSLLGLIVAVLLLVEALGVRQLALGGVVAERIGLVVLAVICLAASALAEWGTNFVVDLTLDQTQLASEVLVIVAMALLAAYFWNIRAGMREYLHDVTEAGAEDAAPAADAK